MSKIKIYTETRRHQISPVLYGVFFEDINYGADGGLYGELVANRSFAYYDRDKKQDKHKMCWEATGGADFQVLTAKPLNSAQNHYASVTGGRYCGIRNTGWCGEGFAVQDGDILCFSCYASAEIPTEFIVRVVDQRGSVYASASLRTEKQEWTKHEEERERTEHEGERERIEHGENRERTKHEEKQERIKHEDKEKWIKCEGEREWKKYEKELQATGSCKNAFLEILLSNGGNMDFSFVSLFPKDTFLGRKNGLRRDLAEMIRDLKPKFMRFPGGCIVEGRSVENMYRWKDTIGPVEERKTNWNRWQMEEYQPNGQEAEDYFQSCGLGFFEYFQFCEDIGAKPVPVINCGMTCQWHEGILIDMDQLDSYVQDVLDLIEFANGDENSEWGRRRAGMGHPKPFSLEYIGIGNEQWGEQYFERYEIFQKRIAERYPEIKLITCAGWNDSGWEFDIAQKWMSQNKDKAYAVDEHFYKSPEWFLDNISRYDHYDRTMPKVMIGEYAAHTASGISERKNSWKAALAEAAFLTGVENNSDHVVMTAYAPLLAREKHNQWQPNLIWFDNENIFGTPNYYVQKLFSENTGEYALAVETGDVDIPVCASISQNGRLIVKAVNLSGKDRTLDFALDESFEICKVTEIAAPLDAENSMEEPYRVCPVTYSVGIKSSEARLEIKQYSVNVFELYRCCQG